MLVVLVIVLVASSDWCDHGESDMQQYQKEKELSLLPSSAIGRHKRYNKQSMEMFWIITTRMVWNQANVVPEKLVEFIQQISMA